MCGRYLVLSDDDYEEIRNLVDEISDKFNKTEVVKGEVCPTNNVPVVYSHNGKKILSSAKWGFPNFKNSGVIINARAETVAEKPMFKRAFASNRCLVPASGYYEWLTHEDKSKTKYLMSIKGKPFFYMAGLYNMFTDKSGSPYAAITIVTTEANTDLAFIHNRMPVILPDEAVNLWLNKDNTDLILLQGLLTPYSVDKVDFAIS